MEAIMILKVKNKRDLLIFLKYSEKSQNAYFVLDMFLEKVVIQRTTQGELLNFKIRISRMSKTHKVTIKQHLARFEGNIMI